MIDIIKTYNLNVNFNKGKFTSEDKIIFVEKDNKSSKLVINFEENINEQYVCLKLKHYSGIVKEIAFLVRNNTAEVVITNDILIAGKMKMSIGLIGSENEILTNIEYLDNIEIKESLGDGEDFSEKELDTLQEILSDITKLKNDMGDISSILDEINGEEI